MALQRAAPRGRPARRATFGPSVLTLLKTILMAACGIALGLSATALAVRGGFGFGAVHAGSWTAWPGTGTRDIDPYARATIARSGEIPLGLAEGLLLAAARDAGGEWLEGRCDYAIAGAVPASRFWTLTLGTPDGAPIANPLHRHGMTSSEVVRDEAGHFEITISAHARPGNWLPVGHDKRFVAVLRLYDTVASASAAALDAAALPVIRRTGCR